MHRKTTTMVGDPAGSNCRYLFKRALGTLLWKGVFGHGRNKCRSELKVNPLRQDLRIIWIRVILTTNLLLKAVVSHHSKNTI